MRVVCPFTRIHPLTDAALQAHAPHAERIRIPENDLVAYCKLLTERWALVEDLLVVEQDIEIRAGLIEEAEQCTEGWWCCWPYMGQGWSNPSGDALIYESLGCTKFSAELMRAEPDLLMVAGSIRHSKDMPPGDWHRLDVSISPTLKQRGYTPHRHMPPVIHHHLYAEGCSCGNQDCRVLS